AREEGATEGAPERPARQIKICAVFAPALAIVGFRTSEPTNETPRIRSPRPQRPCPGRLRPRQPSHPRKLRRPRSSPRPSALVRPLRRLRIVQCDLAAARL